MRAVRLGAETPMNRSTITPVVVDVETTGFGSSDRIVEIAAVTLDPVTWETVDEFDTLINPERDVGPTGVHGISASMVEAAPTFGEVIGAVAARLRDTVLIAHNLVFDQRMLVQEFVRQSVAIDPGRGLCTYRLTRKKLALACNDLGVRLTQQHRALADARATADLARRLRLARRSGGATPTHIGEVPYQGNHHTLRRGLADSGTSPMHRIVCRASYPDGDTVVGQYLDMLDWVLDDGVIDARERSEMHRLARELGISRTAQMDAHRGYLMCIIAAAERDGIVSAAERQLIVRIAEQLNVRDVPVPDVTSTPTADTVAEGARICFTGTPNKARLEGMAERAGFKPVHSVTKKGCDVLVAADVTTASGKARKARKYGIPIMPAHEFVQRFGNAH